MAAIRRTIREELLHVLRFRSALLALRSLCGADDKVGDHLMDQTSLLPLAFTQHGWAVPADCSIATATNSQVPMNALDLLLSFSPW
jgi:hypothetical protein